MSVHRLRQATAETVLADLGAVYGAAAPQLVRRHPTRGVGRGGSPPHLESVRLRFQVGGRADDVEIGTSVRETDEAHAVCVLLLGSRRWRNRPRSSLSIRIDKTTIDIPVDHETHSFNVYTCGREARAQASVSEREITVQCSKGSLRKLRLKNLSFEEISEFFPAEKEIFNPKLARSLQDRSRRSHRQPTPKKALEALGAVYGPKRSRPFPSSAFLSFERSGDEVAASYLGVLMGRRRQQIVVRTSVEPINTEPVLNLLIHRVNSQARLDFPLELSVRRETIDVPVDGESTPFTALVCGDVTHIEASLDGRTITVDGPLEVLQELELVGLGEAQMAKMIRARRDWEHRAREESRRSK